jgi:hypothetical protein
MRVRRNSVTRWATTLPLAYLQGMCDKVSGGQTYAQTVADLKSDFTTSEKYQASHPIDKGCQRMVPRADLAAAQLGGALPATQG